MLNLLLVLLLAPAPAKPTPAPDLEGMVKKTGAHTYLIDSARFEASLSDMALWSRGARVVPAYREGKPIGFRLAGVRPGSLYVALGLRSGDVLRTISGWSISSPAAAMAIYAWAKKAKRLELAIERANKPVTLVYDVPGPGRVDAPPPPAPPPPSPAVEKPAVPPAAAPTSAPVEPDPAPAAKP